MNMRRAFLTPVVLSFLVAGGVGLTGWGGTSAQAVSWNTAVVPVSGTVSGEPESVAFSGEAQIETRLAVDPEDSTRDKILVQIDLGSVAGEGLSTQATYVIPAGGGAIHRPRAASDVVVITFPFSEGSVTGDDSARSGVASFAFDFDTATGAVLAATASIGDVQ